MTSKKYVYIVEDDVDILELLAALLLKSGFEIVADWNGNNLERNLNNSKPPDLYIMDINLYGKSGLDLCKKVKEYHPSKPVLIISATHNATQKATAVGADAFIEKPFDLRYLVKQINVLTGNLKQEY